MKEPKIHIHRISTEREKTGCAQLMAGSELWTIVETSMEHILNTLNDPLHEVYAAFEKDEIVGTMVIHTKGAFSGYLKSISVKPGRSGQQLAEQMMAFIEDEIFPTYKNLFLCVSSFNLDAQHFFLKLGYEQIGVLKDYLVEGHDEILMRKTIAPILQPDR